MTNCIFCHHITQEAILFESQSFKLVFDIDPIQTGHLLIISKEHYQSLAELPTEQAYELMDLQRHIVKLLEEHLPIDGVTIASNDKDLMDEGTHFHVHLIPRLKGDGFWDKVQIPMQDFPTADLTEQLNQLKT